MIESIVELFKDEGFRHWVFWIVVVIVLFGGPVIVVRRKK